MALRVCLDPDAQTYYPYPFIDKKERWMAARFGLTRGRLTKNQERVQELKYDTLDILQKSRTW